jgi:2-methylcitrate dehydratase PrpD
MGVTRTLARYAVETKYEDLPKEVVEQAKVATLNILAVALGGYKTRIGQLHITMAKEIGGGNPQATIIGDGSKVSCPLAAYANGNLAFALDYEDMIRYILHPGYVSVSAGLAVGEKVKATGKDFLTAIVLAYEVAGRIGISMQPTPERGSKVWGEQYTPFGAAVPAGKLLGLDEDQMDIAFGVAGTYASVPSAYKYFGLVKDTRPMKEIKLGWGWQCMAGVFGALSAKEGFRGGYGVLDGEEGFWIMEGSDKCDFEKMTEGLGTEYLTMEAEFKNHPSMGWINTAHEATRALVEEHDVQAEEVEQVIVTGVGGHRVDDFDPAGAVDAMFSLPYGVATTILREKLLPDMYSEKKLKDPKIRELMRKITFNPDDEADRLWFDEQWIVYTIELIMKDGTHLKNHVEWPKDRPPFGKKEVEQKFRDLASLTLSDEQVEEVLQKVYELEKVKDITALTNILHP